MKPRLGPCAFHALVLFALGGLASCASMTEQQCLEGDWVGKGRSDGKEGRNPEYRLDAHAKACEKTKITPNRAAYMEGWREGMAKYYCTPEGGFDAGRRGARQNAEFCSPQAAALFNDNYRLGHEIHRIESEISRVESEINMAEKKLQKKDTGAEEKNQLRRKIDDLRWTRSDLRAMLSVAESRPLIRGR